MVDLAQAHAFLRDYGIYINYTENMRDLKSRLVCLRAEKSKPFSIEDIAVIPFDGTIYYTRLCLNICINKTYTYTVSFDAGNFDKYMQNPELIWRQIMDTLNNHMKILPKAKLNTLLYSKD